MTSLIFSITRRVVTLSLGWLLSAPLLAQSDLPVLPLSQVNRPAGWQLVGTVSDGPSGTLKTSPGSTVLVGSRDPLTLATPTDDFRMRFEMLTTAGTDASLSLPTGQTLSFGRMRDLSRLLKAPGLWQTVELWYKTGKANSPSNPRGAVLEKLVLNGVTVREGQVLTGRASGPVAVMVPSGTVAIRNVGYRVLLARNVAQWSGPLSYTIYEGENAKREELSGRKVLKQDTAAVVNYEVAYGQPRRYSILFAGKLNTLQAGDYQFELHQGGIAGLWVDGKEIIPATYHELGQPETRTANLTAGSHDVRVFFTRSWARPGLGLFVSQAGTRPQPLHALSSLPEPDPVGVISVTPETKSQLIRSFVQMPDEKTKRTHSLSVGSPSGYHYTLDLNQMTLLQAWKGDFANVTEMWYERGEPQLLSPMGTTVYLPAQPALTVLTNESTESTTAAWPDSLNENTLRYKGLRVDKQGVPTISYELAGLAVTDAVQPQDDALVRTLSLTGSPDGTPGPRSVYCRIAAGSSVEEVSKGLYAINDRSYYVRFDPKAKVKLRQSNGKQELLLPVAMKNGSGSVQYAIVF